MVLMAGMSSWIEAKDGSRIGMGVTLILTISTLIQGLKSQLPKVSYLTALDIYLWACFGFVFLNVGYCCYINYWMTLKIEEEKHELTLAKMKAVLIDRGVNERKRQEHRNKINLDRSNSGNKWKAAVARVGSGGSHQNAGLHNCGSTVGVYKYSGLESNFNSDSNFDSGAHFNSESNHKLSNSASKHSFTSYGKEKKVNTKRRGSAASDALMKWKNLLMDDTNPKESEKLGKCGDECCLQGKVCKKFIIAAIPWFFKRTKRKLSSAAMKLQVWIIKIIFFLYKSGHGKKSV